MADLPPELDSTADTGNNGDAAGRGSPPGMPRWVRVFGIIAIVLIVAFIIRHLTGGGFHGHISP
jgi:hypothetical protein